MSQSTSVILIGYMHDAHIMAVVYTVGQELRSDCGRFSPALSHVVRSYSLNRLAGRPG